MTLHGPSTSEIRQRVDNLLGQKRNYRQEIKELIGGYQYVVFYGCGTVLRGIIGHWNTHIGRKIDYCCDSDSSKWGKSFHGARCLSPSELIEIKESCAVFLSIGDFMPVYNFLKAGGCPAVNHFYKYDLLSSDYLGSDAQDDILTSLCNTYDLLEDNQSRKVFDAVITRVLGRNSNIDIMLNVSEGNQYFPTKLIQLSENERLADVGAFNGDTIKDFVQRTRGKFDNIFSFELDAINFKLLQEGVRNMSDSSRISVYNLGIWDYESEIAYEVGDLNSTTGIGESNGHAVTLDYALPDEKITFIKIDIEGAELRALRGAKNIIQNQKPKLAVCVYHDFRHLWEIPLYIKALVPEYKIYLRHHSSLEYETVCYAVID